MRRLFPVLIIFLLAACGQKDTDAGPGGVSVGEARALDQAASMLDKQRLPTSALASSTPAPQRPASPTPAASHSPPP